MTEESDSLARLAPSPESAAGYLFWLSRPRFWLYLAGPVLVGVAFGAPTPSALLQPVTVVLFAYFLVPANLFLYGVNDIFDADVDRHNPKKGDIGREVRFAGQRGTLAAVVGAGLGGLLLVPLLPTSALLALAGFFALGIAYSAPPLRLKTRPGLDSVSNGLYVLPGVVAYTAVAGMTPPMAAVAGGWVWAMGMHTFSAIPDVEPDRAAGIRTTATVLGPGPTRWYCLACWVGAAALFALVHPLLGALLAVYPLFLATVSLGNVDIDRAYWWFPALNTLVGALLTMGGLWVVLRG